MRLRRLLNRAAFQLFQRGAFFYGKTSYKGAVATKKEKKVIDLSNKQLNERIYSQFAADVGTMLINLYHPGMDAHDVSASPGRVRLRDPVMNDRANNNAR